MKVKVLGTRGEIKESLPSYSNHSGVLIDGKLLLDLGEKEFLNYSPKWIFLTHLHPDHAYFVRWGKEEIPPAEAQIYAPELPKNEAIESCVRILQEPIEISGYTIIPIPTHHSKRVKSQAYLVKKKKQSLLYTGDMIWINKEYHPLFEYVDLVITEGSFIRKGGMVRQDKETHELFGHTGIPNLMDLFKNHTKHILFVHFGSWFYQDPTSAQKKLALLGKEKGVHPIAAYDGFELDTAKL